MSRFAPVVPVQLAKALQSHPVGDLLGGYHLLLAHDVLLHKEEYAAVYRPIRQKYKDAFIIMDNSIVELGAAVTAEVLIEAAETVDAHCIVIPDVMGNGKETRELGTQFVRQYCEKYVKNNKEPIQLMAVIQGENVSDAMKTYGHFYLMPPIIEYVSLPRVFQQRVGSRMPLVEEILHRPVFGKPLHLLGFSDDLLDDVACARMSNVSGIDSAVPIRAGFKGLHLDISHPRKDFGKREDFWEKTEIPGGDIDEMVQMNLKLIREWIDNPTSSN